MAAGRGRGGGEEEVNEVCFLNDLSLYFPKQGTLFAGF